MINALVALVGRLFQRSPAAVSTSVAFAATVPAVSALSAARPGTPIPMGLGARRPLVATGGALAGFEFHAGNAGRSRAADDDQTARARTNSVLGAMRLCIGQDKIALAELPPGWLARCDPDQALVPGMYLVLGADAMADDPVALAALIRRLRGAGTLVGWPVDPGVGRHLPPGRPDFLTLPAPAGQERNLQAWQQAVQQVAQDYPSVPLVLLELPNVDLLEALLRAPVLLAGCTIGASLASSRTQKLPPQAQTLLQLLNRLVRDDDHAVLVADIKADPALSLRMLQHLNSAGASNGTPLESIEQAVMVLGRDELYRWVAQMLVRLSPGRPAAAALQAMALARARLLELLAHSVDEPNPGSLYLLGLASMLPLLMQCSVDEALDWLQLPAPATEALLQQTGPWLPYLALVHALERNDLLAAESLARPFGGLDRVLAQSARAWLPAQG